MFKQFFTLFRGAANSAAEDFTDQHALTLLQQQMRDSAQAVAAARKAVAIAIAQNRQEQAQHEGLVKRIADLERRTVSALDQGKQGLAREAAECIALMENERDTSAKALRLFSDELGRLKVNVQAAEIKLRELGRGQKLAVATDKVQKMREQSPQTGLTALNDAEATLTRLRQRQAQIDLTSQAMDEMAQTGNPASIVEKLAESGCGAPLKSSVDDVLARLSRKKPKKQA